MYDKKYLEEGNVKEIATVEDALLILATERICGSCRECPVRMYEASKGGDCNRTLDKARKFLAKHYGTDTDKDGWKNVVSKELCAHLGSNHTQTDEEACEGTCATCLSSDMHPSGIRFCHSWHNFTHDDGFCYRYKSDKIEGEAAEENWKELSKATKVKLEDNEVEIPF